MKKRDTGNWVLLRGLIREQRHWEGFPDKMRAAYPDANIITIDVAGNGTRYQETSPTTIRGLMESVRSELERQQHQPPFSLLALSMGAMIAMEWMVRHPQDIQRGVLINSSLSAFNPFYQRLNPRNYTRILGGFFERDLFQRERSILQMTSNMRADHDAIALRWASYAQQYPMARANAIRQLRASARFSQPSTQPTQPLLVLCSKNDRLVNNECSHAIAQRWQTSIAQHPHAGHDLPLDDADWIIQQLDEPWDDYLKS